MKVGIASSREKMKVNFHLRVVRMWLIPARLLSAVYRQAVNPAPCTHGKRASWSLHSTVGLRSH
jgi:hypothetical protein